jgi:hypothetical protein
MEPTVWFAEWFGANAMNYMWTNDMQKMRGQPGAGATPSHGLPLTLVAPAPGLALDRFCICDRYGAGSRGRSKQTREGTLLGDMTSLEAQE